MNNQDANRNFLTKNYSLNISIKRLAILLLAMMLLLQACGVNSPTPAASSATPAAGFNSPQPVISTAAPSPTPGKNQAHESVLPPSAMPTAAPTTAPTATITPTPEPTSTETAASILTDTQTTGSPVVFAVIGDYGSREPKEGEVADLVKSWNPDFIITVGDNNYPDGNASQIDDAVGKYYHDYIYPYTGSYGAGADVNRFFPTIGNHDLMTDKAQPYLDYFSLPGNERYYDFVWGPLHFFALNDVEDPDGLNSSSIQAQWLKQKLTESTSAWNIVYMHYPPYSSGKHGSTDWARWPFAEWGADVVLSGHSHGYERLNIGGLTYIVNGLGGAGIYDFKETIDGIQVRYNSDLGAMRVEATDTTIKFEFITRGNEVIDTYTMNK